MRNLFNKKIILIIFFLVFFIGTTIFFLTKNKVQADDNCVNPYELKDFTTGTDAVRICNNTLYRGSMEVISKDELPDLFIYNFGEDKEPIQVKQFVRVFEKDNDEYVSIKSEVDFTTWNNSAIGIFRKGEDAYKLVFKKGFDDNQGRWVNIKFGEDSSYKDPYFYLNYKGEGFSISGDIGYLGCYGACRMLWWDYYDWDSNKNTYVLSNNKHVDAFKLLLETYKDFDNNTCMDEANINTSISDLYPVRKDKKKICIDTVDEPSTTIGQAEMLLKGIKAIEMIINGENVSRNEVKDIKLD